MKPFFFFFEDHLFLGGKSVWISEFSEKFLLNFRINRVILIQEQWKFGSRSFVVFSLFKKSPPPPFFKSWLRACHHALQNKIYKILLIYYLNVISKSFIMRVVPSQKRATSWQGPSPRHCAWGRRGFLRRNFEMEASCWQYSVPALQGGVPWAQVWWESHFLMEQK